MEKKRVPEKRRKDGTDAERIRPKASAAPQQGKEEALGKGCMHIVGVHVHSLEHGMSERKARKKAGHLTSASGSLPTMKVSGEGPGAWLRVTPRSWDQTEGMHASSPSGPMATGLCTAHAWASVKVLLRTGPYL